MIVKILMVMLAIAIVSTSGAPAPTVPSFTLQNTNPQPPSKQTDDKLRLMGIALRARDAGDFAGAQTALAELAQIVPDNKDVQRMRQEVDAKVVESLQKEHGVAPPSGTMASVIKQQTTTLEALDQSMGQLIEAVRQTQQSNEALAGRVSAVETQANTTAQALTQTSTTLSQIVARLEALANHTHPQVTGANQPPVQIQVVGAPVSPPVPQINQTVAPAPQPATLPTPATLAGIPQSQYAPGNQNGGGAGQAVTKDYWVRYVVQPGVESPAFDGKDGREGRVIIVQKGNTQLKEYDKAFFGKRRLLIQSTVPTTGLYKVYNETDVFTFTSDQVVVLWELRKW